MNRRLLFVFAVFFVICCSADAADQSAKLAKPTPEQLAWHDMEIEMFLCLDPCTWQDREYDNHSTPLEKINPAKLDTDQWVRVAESMGAGQILFVAKHTGGFCWWQTETSDYGVRNTPWRGGKGDVVADLAESCKKRGIKLGIYLSPRDDVFGAGGGGRCKGVAAQKRYNEIYRRQLTELLSRYGKIHEVWFDGSLVVDVGDILKKHTPDAMIFQGPRATIRWVGNELGVAPYPAWNGVSEEAAKSGVATARHGDPNGTVWLPNECDARIRSTWFWNTRNANTLKTVDQLMDMYYRSVGHGAVLLLNNTPDTTGLIPEADARRSAEFGAEIRRRFGKSIAETSGRGGVVTLDLGRPTAIDHVIVMENIAEGERIRRYTVEGLVGDDWRRLSEGTAVGHKKIDRINMVEVSKVRLRCTESAAEPIIRKLAVYNTDPEDPEVVAKLAKPTEQQAQWHDFEIGTFIHFGPATWQDHEYDDLSTPMEKINPARLDTDQWAAAAEAMGAKYVVFVAKHTGGFCWWQTETTDYSVKNIPWRGGKGDVMRELAESCRKRGIKLGVYLSPHDRKFGAGGGGRCGSPEAQDRYNKIYRQQLTELLNRYGEMVEVWFDGSNVIEVGDILKKHAPRAMVFQGPHATIRWVGNESGVAPYPGWNAVSAEAAKSGVATARHGDPNGDVWLPNECDARIRAQWFWNSRNAGTLKSVDQLMEMYYRSVGHGAVLLLNHTPDTTGLIPEADVKRGAEFAAEIRRRFGKSVAETSGLGRLVELDLKRPTAIDHVVTMEDIRHGERVRRYVVEGMIRGQWQPLCEGTAIGHKKIDRIDAVEVTKVRLRVSEAATMPRIRQLAVYAAGGKFEPPEPRCQTPVAHWTCDAVQDGRLIDSSGRDRHGHVHDMAIVDKGRTGSALKFDGRKSFVELGKESLFLGDFTIAAWVNAAKPDAAGLRIILSKETSTVGAHQCRFYLTGDRRIGFMICGLSGGGLWPFESESAVSAGQWSHVAVARSGDAFTLYHNGKAIARKKAAAPIRHRNGISLKLGAVFDPSGTRLNVFDGLIDDVRIYNRPLSADDVKRLAVLKEPAETVKPVAAWKWSPETIGTEWSTILIDITPFCKEATQYRVEFQKTGGKGELEVRSLTAVFGGRRIQEYVERDGTGNAFIVTVPGLGIPLKLEAVVRGKKGGDHHGRVLVTRQP